MIKDDPVLVSRVGAVGVIELAQPKAMNALSKRAFDCLELAIDEFERANSGVRVILIRAQGKDFCAGADLKEAKPKLADSELLGEFIRQGHRVLQRLEQSELPVVVACQGLTLAGGGELLLACDVAFASTDFRFGDQHAQYGLLPGWGGSQRLPRIVGLRRSLDLFFSASWIDAVTAQQWGLVNHVVEPEKLAEASMTYCARLATRSRNGLAAMKRLARRAMEGALADGLNAEIAEVLVHMPGPDVSEGLAAFESRREPVFKG